MKILHSNILGEGKPLLILHGFLGMSDNWKTLGTQFVKMGYEVHLLDQRNHGKSFWSEDFNYDLLADDLVRYLEHYKLDKVDILGHSMGGKTAMTFACAHPERIDKLIVADIAPKFYPPHHQYILDALLAIPEEKLRSRSAADFALAQDLHDWSIRQFLLKSLHWVEKGKLDFRFNLRVLAGKMEEIGDALDSGAIFNGPVLFLRGSRSEYVSDDDYATIINHFPNARMETVSDAGHWLHAENPQEFMQFSAEFLNS
ncbi:MAG: alpha/beta fold hydrolase [Flavobacteriaceae bacterium]|nr:alpha/beta fold hydrolase [Eudoraea sp.]NNJ37696.1 alpha/beta fold hydrolase [Flavobacteriaceae bacterium]